MIVGDIQGFDETDSGCLRLGVPSKALHWSAPEPDGPHCDSLTIGTVRPSCGSVALTRRKVPRKSASKDQSQATSVRPAKLTLKQEPLP
mmetsp:Transcript_20640/g.32287  ORF Transcript_20640/g.32287 Transcript_20640/m.32287 type:complete len:89 (-) Transcript_20640:531-797(-)